jgi:iron complex outermembrane receptor protein
MQLSGTPLGIPLGASAGSSIENLGDSTINGLEVELTAQVTENLRLDFVGATMDAGFDCLVIVDVGFNRVGCSPEQIVSAGDSTYTINSPLPRTPDISYNVGASYIVPLPNGGELSGRVDYKYMDDYVFTAAPKPQELGAGYDFVNARLTYTPADDPWSITVGATNLTDEQYITGIIHGGLNTKVAVARPRHVCASFDYGFGSSAR